jgi:ABC-2 type transport system permease protein
VNALMKLPLMKTPFATQVRREFWEHRSLWIVPLAAAGLLFVGSLFAGAAPSGPIVLMGSVQSKVVFGTAIAFAVFLSMIVSIQVCFYLLDCLYAERKDRSILFWKSLPVTDTQAVLVKFVTGLVIVPLGAWLLALVTHLLASGVFALRGSDFGDMAGVNFVQAWGSAQLRLAGGLLTAMLWYAPVAAYLMLASVFSRRAPVVMASLPIVVPMLLERMFLGTNEFAMFIARRLSPWRMRGEWVLDGERGLMAPFFEPQMWLGLVAAAGMLYMVIRLRRYRDDT